MAPLKVVYPFTVRRDEAEAALAQYAPGYLPVDVSAHDEAYFDLLSDLWRAGEDFAIVEHDVVIHDQVIPQFEQCGQPWCLNAYPRHDLPEFLLMGNLGCTRFTEELLLGEPDVLEEAIGIVTGMPPKHWVHIDDRIRFVLRQRRLVNGHLMVPHVHEPPVRHLEAA